MTFGRRVVILLLILSLLAGLITGEPLYYRVAYLWVTIYAVSWIASRLALKDITVKRNARFLRSQVGQVFEERFELINESRIPRLWVEVRDHSRLPHARGSHVLSLIGGSESRSYIVRTRLMKRGVFPLGKTVIKSGDPFGLFPVERTFPIENSLLVYPKMVDIQFFPTPLGFLSGGENVRQRTHQITANAAGIRDYAPGDPLNRIHWLSTARRNRLMAKEFELDPLSQIWIFLDAASRVQSELPRDTLDFDNHDIWRPMVKVPLPPSTEEYSVSIAATIARYYVLQGRSVGFVSAGSSLHVIPSEKGRRQLSKILETLTLLRAEGDLPLQAVVEAEVRNLPRGSTIILITADMGDGVFIPAEHIIRMGMNPIVVLLDASSFGGAPGTGNLYQDLKTMQIPVIMIKNGADLEINLSFNQKKENILFSRV